MQETWVRSLGWEDPLEKETAIHSSTIAWKIPCIVLSKVPYLYCTFFLSLIFPNILSSSFIHSSNIYSASIMGQAQF